MRVLLVEDDVKIALTGFRLTARMTSLACIIYSAVPSLALFYCGLVLCGK